MFWYVPIPVKYYFKLFEAFNSHFEKTDLWKLLIIIKMN